MFEQEEVRTGRKERNLWIGCHHVSVFLVSGSPEERGIYVGEIIKGDPRIVLCSLQYTDGVQDSFQFFLDHGFFPFVHWLNPGHKDLGKVQDSLGLVPWLLEVDSLIGLRDGRADATGRVEEIRDFIRGWALGRDLLK